MSKLQGLALALRCIDACDHNLTLHGLEKMVFILIFMHADIITVTACDRSRQKTETSECVSIGSNCPGISRTVPDYKNLSRVPECYVKCPGRVLTYVLRQENRKGSVAIVSTRCCE